MNIIIAPDSFKGSLSAQKAGLAIERGIKRFNPEIVTAVKPMADGGEGTMDCLVAATNGRYVAAVVKNPLGIDIESGFGILGDGITCIIELAMSSGLYLIDEAERNPMATTTYGFGQLILAALDQGCRRFILGLGGSATNDGGAGMLQALGVELIDEHHQPIGYGGGELGKIASIRLDHMDNRILDSQFIIACDVDNPLIGPNGASAVFGPQKGATSKMVQQLDHNLKHFADMIEQVNGMAIHHISGTGAAGGLAGGILAFLKGELESGVSIVSRLTGLDEAVRHADLVITGEGRVDGQTLRGKTPAGVAQIAKRYHVPVIVLTGSIGEGYEGLYEHGVLAVVSMVNRPMKLEEAMEAAELLLEQAAEQIIRIYSH
ncbi:glycerate kinase family protein [Paenibacillus marinisediminis]